MNRRRASEWLILILYFAVPQLDLFRIDILGGHYYWMTLRFSFAQSLPLLLTIVFLVFLVIGLNFFKPRMFCSHACPHNTASQILRSLKKWKLDLPVALLATPVITFTLLSYFVAPGDIWRALTTFQPLFLALTFLVLSLFIGGLVLRMRARFCANICPYGFFQQLITPERTSRSKQILVSTVMLVLASSMIASAMTTPGVEIALSNGARIKTGPATMTYTYNLALVNNQRTAETFHLTFHALRPVGNHFDAPLVLQPGEEKLLPFAFQATHNEQVAIEICTASGTCKSFNFTLSGY